MRIISGFPPGGINDTYARLIGQWLSERLGQQFIVENRPGAGGNIAAETMVRAAPDGYTLLLTTSADAWNTTLYDNLKFEISLLSLRLRVGPACWSCIHPCRPDPLPN